MAYDSYPYTSTHVNEPIVLRPETQTAALPRITQSPSHVAATPTWAFTKRFNQTGPVHDVSEYAYIGHRVVRVFVTMHGSATGCSAYV